MNSKLIVTIAIASITVLSSCKKDDTKTEPMPITLDYASLKVGNYWVYETYFTDQQGIVSITDDYDSTYIEKDTMIDGKKFFKKIVLSKWNPSVSFWREENGKLVNHLGKTLPTEAGKLGAQIYNGGGTDTIAVQTNFLLAGETSISVPAGVYQVRTIEHVLESYEGTPQNRKIYVKRNYSKYHPTKGDIYRSFSYAHPSSKAVYEVVLARTNVE